MGSCLSQLKKLMSLRSKSKILCICCINEKEMDAILDRALSRVDLRRSSISSDKKSEIEISPVQVL